MRELWEEFRNMDARARAPYETRAAKDMDRYRREVDEPCCIIFVFLKLFLCLRHRYVSAEALCFRAVRACLRASGAYFLLARYLTNQWMEFHHAVIDDEV